MVGAGLLLRTLDNLRRTEVGFNPQNILLFRLNPLLNRYDQTRHVVVQQDLPDLQAIPGVRSVSASDLWLLTGDEIISGISINGQQSVPSDGARVHIIQAAPENLLSVSVRLPLTYRTPAQRNDFWQSALDSVRALPLVESAVAMVNAPPPLGGGDMMLMVGPEESSRDLRTQGVRLSFRPVSPEYFKTLGVPIRKGRPLLESDRAGNEGVVVLNELAARALWPAGDAIGKRIRGYSMPLTVVGVVADFKLTWLNTDASPQMYVPYIQDEDSGASAAFMVRVRPGAGGLAEALRSVIANQEKGATITIATMDDVRWNLLATERFRTSILLIFALAATFLATVGIFGVVSYSVVQRQREIGLRIALGATPHNVIRLMLREAFIPAALGLAIGLAASLQLARLLSSFLFEIQATDPLTFVFASISLLAASMLASFVPARKATRIDPMVTLRYD